MNSKVTDPVCGMEIAVDSSALQCIYEGKVYYFCSTACEDQFAKELAKYAKKDSGCCGGHGEHGKHKGHGHHGEHGCCH